MAFEQPSIIAILIINGFLGVLFAYLVYEGFQLSKADDATQVEYRKPWLDKFLKIVVGILSSSLVLIAVTMGNGYFFGF
jgi:hypothetical protein